MSRVLCRSELPCGAASAVFTVDELLDALHNDHSQYVFAQLDGGGALAAAGGGGGARLAARARLAPSLAHVGALLARAAGGLLLRAAAAAPGHELLLWFDEDALGALDMPVLTPRNLARAGYACHECGAHFACPTPLKLHLFLRCAPPEPRRFWREAAARLRPAPAPGPALLEALAAAAGRSRAGHACVYCGKLYSRRYGLKIHLRTHTGYRPLRCRYCLRAFGDPSNLNKHVRLHLARLTAAPAPPAPPATPTPTPGCK